MLDRCSEWSFIYLFLACFMHRRRPAFCLSPAILIVMEDEWAPIFKEDLLFSDVQFPYATTSNIAEDDRVFQNDLGSSGISPCSSVSSPMDHSATELLIASALEGFDGPFLPLFDSASLASSCHSPSSDTYMALSTSTNYLSTDMPALISPIKREPFHENVQASESQSQNFSGDFAVDSSSFVFRPIRLSDDQDCLSMPHASSLSSIGSNKSVSPPLNLPSLNRKALPSMGRTRSKMHDLAVKSRLITDQNPRGQGTVFLSAEEKRTLIQEGYRLPTKLPLTREEEEALKIVRRKIKNKLSAQESRRKRKEYMDQLEQKVHAYFSDNISLKIRIKQLETTNRELMGRVRKLESALDAAQSQPVTDPQSS
uniref:BZIP domain-containing protein n=1 Tax=Acrobeloides nanus TaxID=290746 RepID=A0A914E1D0_9BILA